MKTIFRHSGMGRLLFAQSQVAFNDNAVKLALIGIIQMVLPATQATHMVGLVAVFLVAPFVIFAPLAGWMADRFSKQGVMTGSLLFQLAVMWILLIAVYARSLNLAVAGFFLLGVQSAIMAPVRLGLVKELAAKDVGEAVGWMEMFCMAAILAGSVAGGSVIDGLAGSMGPWMAGFATFAALSAGCVVALHVFRRVPQHELVHAEPFRAGILFGHFDLLNRLRSDRGLFRAALGNSVFYFAGGMLLLILTQAGRQLHPDGVGVASATSVMLALLGIGVACGSMIAARLSRWGIPLGLVPFGAIGMSGALGAMAFLDPGSIFFLGALTLLGVAGGVYLVPLGSYLVDRSPEDQQGRVLAASSMLSSLAGVIAVLVFRFVEIVFGFGITGQLLLISLCLFVSAVYACGLLSSELLRVSALVLARLHYSVTPRGGENIPATGGALIVCNHVSYIDTIILSLASRRPIRFLAFEEFFRIPVLGFLLRTFGSIPVSSHHAKAAICRAADAIAQGELVCIFPEGQLTRTGNLMEMKSGFELIARRAECPVLVAHLDGLWGSIFSFSGGRYFFKLPKGLRRAATVSFSPVLEARETTTEIVRETIAGLAADALQTRIQKEGTLGGNLVSALKRHPWSVCVSDVSGGKLRKITLLAMAWRLAVLWRGVFSEKRIGVMLPPGIAGTLTNVALVLAGKSPVNLNPTISLEAAVSCLKQAGINAVITAEPVRRKIPNYPWPATIRSIESDIASVSRGQITISILRCLVLPAAILKRVMALPAASSTDEVLLLFTSGSTGLPKGVPLSHQNILGNATQILETSFLISSDRILSPLPLFHCFGLTMGLFFPLLTGRPLITAPSPLESEKICEAARSGCPTILLSTPTFLRQYTKRISRDAFGTLRAAITGAEKLSPATAAEFRCRFGCEILEGYGLTEASPLASFNLRNPARGLGADSIQIGLCEGSVGRVVPGMAVQFLDPLTEKAQPGATRGVLALRGVNVITGYTGGRDAQKFHAGWYITGDIVSMDARGFLFIEGRASRFSKLGGEMVSHEAVERSIASVLQSEGQDFVSGVPCEEKGEMLVLLTTRKVSREDLREALVQVGLPNLQIPRVVIPLETLPMLPSGKLDLAACRKVAEGHAPAV